jgi:hypothetical protein
MGNSAARQMQIESWKATSDGIKPSDFPEFDRPELNAKPNTAICFSGDGSRTLCMGIGVLAGLREANLLQNIRYIGGISGGAWAAALYIYSQLSDNDAIFLGPLLPPERVSLERLNAMHDLCLRKVATNSFALSAIGQSLDVGLAWRLQVANQLLRPAMIHPSKLFSWDEATVDDILLRNASVGFTAADFLLPRKYSSPYMVLQWSSLGPGKSLLDSPFQEVGTSFQMLEVTPLYIGQMKSSTFKHKDKDFSYGGFVEPIGYSVSGGIVPAKGLAKVETNGFLSMPKPKQGVDMTTVASTSTFVTNSAMKAKYIPLLGSKSIGNTYDYYSPVEIAPTSNSLMFSDGSSVQADPIISFIQRGVERIVSFISYRHPINYEALLNTNDENHWKRSKFIYEDYISPSLTALFGIMPVDLNGVALFPDHLQSQIFETDDFEGLIQGLKAAHERGVGTFFRKTYTLVNNRLFGISGGKRVDITFYVLSRCSSWDTRLDPGLQTLIQSRDYLPVEKSCYDLEPPKSPEFYQYPHYDNVEKTMLTKAEVNMLCDQVGWTIYQNRDFFGKILCK